ncbi:MAG: acetyl-CoA carboxylase biotin carboxyl carrier protein subunit, partial [Muribaculaceae bacterium]
KRRETEYAASKPASTENVVEEVAEAQAPITGPTLISPMGGKIIEIAVKEGDVVKKGTRLLVYEAMKMENDISADRDLTIKKIFVKPNQIIGGDEILIEFVD